MKKNNLETLVTTIISRLLIARGFERRGQVFTKKLSEDTWGWIGLNITKQNLGGGIGISPIIGLIFKPIEDVVQKILKNKAIQPTLTSSLGYLMPEHTYLEWIFMPEKDFDLDHEVQKIVEAIMQYGEIFMRRQSSLTQIINNLEVNQFTNQTAASYRLPIAYKLAGRSDDAHACLMQNLMNIGDRKDIAADEISMFSNTLLYGDEN